MADRQRFLVADSDESGVVYHPMKQWLRAHPEHIPDGYPPGTTNSRSIYRQLRRRGWSFEETPDEIRLFPPGSAAPPLEEEEGESGVDSEISYDPAFRLEVQLRDFLKDNLGAVRINSQSLRLYVDELQRSGVEYPTPTGPIDLLAVDNDGAFYVFELKRAASPDSAIGQLARYMGWVKSTISGGRPVHGVIVAKEITDRLKYALHALSNVSLFEYKIEFRLSNVEAK